MESDADDDTDTPVLTSALPSPPIVMDIEGLAGVLDALCDTTQSHLVRRLMQQCTRLVHCERSVQHSAEVQRSLLSTQRTQIDTQRGAIDELETRCIALQQQLRREKHERREDKEWLAQLWPDGLVLPTLLKPFEALRGDAAGDGSAAAPDPAEVKRMHARINRRVARERVLHQIEASQQWQVVVEPAVTNAETGEVVPERVYFLNVVTGQSAWQAPLEMAYEPPPQWDAVKLDWKDSYGIEHFYDRSSAAHGSDDGDDGANERVKPSSSVARSPSARRRDSSHETSTANDDDDEEHDDDSREDENEDDIPADPVELRAQMTLALARHEQLQRELAASTSQQRTLALQLLNASRESFEREKEALEAEDNTVRDAERKRRRALQQEQAAARAKAEALEKKSNTSVQAKFAKDSVGAKDLTLVKDDELLERELDAFVLEQRADRSYLTVPMTLEPRAKFRHQLDDEYVHMKSMEAQVLAIEQLEFDLLEKSALRHEEASAKSDELATVCEQVRARQPEVDADLESVLHTIARLEVPLSPPTEPQPSEEELQRASVRFVTVKPLEDEEDDDGDNEDSVDTSGGNISRETVDASHSAMMAEVAKEHMTKEEVAALLQDEAELILFKSFVDAEQRWHAWEREEAMRVDELTQALERRKTLECVQRQLALDLALSESDAPFFARLAELEKALNTRMWAIQADSQTERVRFMIERAAREEAIFQMSDRLAELQEQLDAAQRLPSQALNPLERLQLEDDSHKQCTALASQVSELQTKYAKEMTAKTLLIELETRSSRYALEKLEEELALFREKQVLWDLSVTLTDELQAARKTIERLYVLMDDAPRIVPEQQAENALLANNAPDSYLVLQQQQEETTIVFDAKLQTLQHVRQFLLSCYEREARWRQLAAIALVKDASSHEWMTNMQRERHENMLAMLQDQHDHTVQALQQQIKILQSVKRVLQSEIDELRAKLERVQLAYQASSEHVREQTQRIIRALTTEIEQLEQTLRDERAQGHTERERLMRDHNAIRSALDARVIELEAVNEQQHHWLTAANRELHAQRVANEDLVKAYASLEKRRAAETNDMRFRIAAQITKINNIEMWNLSLKLQAKEASRERIALQREMDTLVEQHKQQQRLLRMQNWRQRVAAQAVLTNVDLLFRFFIDGLDVLAGATQTANAALRAHGAIEVLAALAQHCHAQPSIRVVCARALGQLAWNANATPRALGWRAKRKWFTWVTAQSDVALAQLAHDTQEPTPFDAVADEASTATNWLADPSACAGESDSDVVSARGKKLRFMQTWHQLDELQFPDANASNQEHMAISPGVLQTLIDLCHEPSQRKLVVTGLDSKDSELDSDSDADKQIQRNALRSLALVVMQSRNTAIVGHMDGCVALLVTLIAPQEPREDAHVVRNAVLALGHLAFANASNQSAITAHGAISHLLALCSCASDVDLILAATQTLAHLAHHAPVGVCEALLDAGAVPVLAQLCHSPRIYDSIELDVYEQIQTHAAQVIASVVAALESEENESDHRARSVADAILEEEQILLYNDAAAPTASNARAIGGVTSFVLMCASCNRNVAIHAALVLGSIAQHDAIRAAIGAAGGVDALFLLADRRGDCELVLQATWALANLTWNRDNQYRVARYIESLYALCAGAFASVMSHLRPHARVHSNQELDDSGAAHPEQDEDNNSDDQQSDPDGTVARQIREHAFCILANALFYNDANRQLVAAQRKWMNLLHRECLHGHGIALEHAARALCALSYSDAIALAMGVASDVSSSDSSKSNSARALSGLEVFVKLCGCSASALVQRHGLYGVINLCLHDANKSRMLDVPHGIETLVNLSGSTNRELCEPALEALELLADVRELQRDGVVSSRAFTTTDMKKLVALLGDAATSPALVAMVSDAIADEVWKTPSAKVKLRNEHGLEKLLELCVRPLHEIVGTGTGSAIALEQEHTLRISCLWALRNTVSDNVRNQDLVGALGGVEQLVLLHDRHRRDENVVEAILAALTALVMKHPRNSQQLVQFGLDMLLALADGSDGTRTVLPLLVSGKTSGSSSGTTSVPRAELQNAALARELLHLVAPYNTPATTTASTTSGALSSPDKLTRMRHFQQQQLKRADSK